MDTCYIEYTGSKTSKRTLVVDTSCKQIVYINDAIQQGNYKMAAMAIFGRQHNLPECFTAVNTGFTKYVNMGLEAGTIAGEAQDTI